MIAWIDRMNSALERYLPEKRLFLRSDTSTRFVRLKPVSQAVILSGAAVYMTWSLVASAVVFFDVIGSNDLRQAAMREQTYFEQRLGDLAAQRDQSLDEARAAHARYGEAMDRVASMQAMILAAEERNAELARGVDALQSTLVTVMDQRDEALAQLEDMQSQDANAELVRATQRLSETEQTLDMLVESLAETAHQRESVDAMAETTAIEAQHLALEYRLIQDRNERIFSQLEQAVETSMAPLARVFEASGLSPDSILRQIRSGYETRSSALMPISISTSGTIDPASDEARANGIIEALQDIDAYRIALQRIPYAVPVRGARQTSGYGYRSDPRNGSRRMHNGVDWAAAQGTAIHSTADGVVSFAGRQSGYGNVVIIQHDFGIETYYAHLHSIAVREGQRVSRGDRIGGMGTTGRSTGVHLHYEIRVGGRPINPMTYIRAAQNVF